MIFTIQKEFQWCSCHLKGNIFQKNKIFLSLEHTQGKKEKRIKPEKPNRHRRKNITKGNEIMLWSDECKRLVSNMQYLREFSWLKMGVWPHTNRATGIATTYKQRTTMYIKTGIYWQILPCVGLPLTKIEHQSIIIIKWPEQKTLTSHNADKENMYVIQ